MNETAVARSQQGEAFPPWGYNPQLIVGGNQQRIIRRRINRITPLVMCREIERLRDSSGARVRFNNMSGTIEHDAARADSPLVPGWSLDLPELSPPESIPLDVDRGIGRLRQARDACHKRESKSPCAANSAKSSHRGIGTSP